MTQSVDHETVVSRLLSADEILILCHKNQDGDTIGSGTALCLALQKLGKTAEAKAALQEMEAFLERTRTALDSYAKFGEANQNVRESNIAFYSGLVHLLKQDEKAAQADFAKALELYPGNIWAEKTK